MSDPLLGTVQFKSWRCSAVLRTYRNGRPAIVLLDPDDGELVACATVNVPDYPLADGEVIAKNYNENASMLEALIAGGIVTASGKIVPVGYAEGHVCRLVSKQTQ